MPETEAWSLVRDIGACQSTASCGHFRQRVGIVGIVWALPVLCGNFRCRVGIAGQCRVGSDGIVLGVTTSFGDCRYHVGIVGIVCSLPVSCGH